MWDVWVMSFSNIPLGLSFNHLYFLGYKELTVIFFKLLKSFCVSVFVWDFQVILLTEVNLILAEHHSVLGSFCFS